MTSKNPNIGVQHMTAPAVAQLNFDKNLLRQIEARSGLTEISVYRALFGTGKTTRATYRLISLALQELGRQDLDPSAGNRPSVEGE